jgi:predicted DCC family thiol-disulfide oxidoreductase YuxK
MNPTVQHIVLFDGVCNLCNASVQFIIHHDSEKKFYFASLQSETGEILLKKHGIDPAKTDSVIYITNGKAYTRSTAALRIASQLDGPVKLLSVFRIVPRFIRNAVYDCIAANRYRWFGKREYCMIPTKEHLSRFLS